ncbi:unnamed protein product [Spirodela intermedia]|uniref:Uncharacterized protein n=1 Tax=Spirodela intermedia TaxID=51605 RepID=A0A7I8IS66_SPIIN|nr:unnamed protein product [Spirodela intermedia]CAA6660377.1 unnamed protein product [Spirodela intermedia]
MEAEKPWLGIGGAVWGSVTRPTAVILLFAAALLGLSWLQTTTDVSILSPAATATGASGDLRAAGDARSCSGFYRPQPARKVVMSVAEFGGVGDGKTSNTGAFRLALNVPRGEWLTGSFNLTSNFTLFLEEGAVILGSQVSALIWPREGETGGRHISLVHADGVSNVVITGQNGSIDGQGRMWWELWRNRTLEHTRGHLLELMNSDNVLISNVTFLNSPFWTIHPVYCSNVVIKDVTVLAPLDSPNTDGIDPDSSSHVCIEDCYIESGDDLVAVKAGGITTAWRVSGTTPTCSGVGIGSEMSGGISNVLVEALHVWDSAAAVRLKTDRGRGGYIANVTITNVTMERVKIPIRFSRGADDHPDEAWDAAALPRVTGISISNVVGVDVRRPPLLEGVEGAGYDNICLSNVNLQGLAPTAAWRCEFVSGDASGVFPFPCPQLRNSSSHCIF